jgi:hypothetical protein
MQDFASVLPVQVFVQMAAAVQIKFKSSVACGMHPEAERSQTGTNESLPTVEPVIAVDPG